MRRVSRSVADDAVGLPTLAEARAAILAADARAWAERGFQRAKAGSYVRALSNELIAVVHDFLGAAQRIDRSGSTIGVHWTPVARTLATVAGWRYDRLIATVQIPLAKIAPPHEPATALALVPRSLDEADKVARHRVTVAADLAERWLATHNTPAAVLAELEQSPPYPEFLASLAVARRHTGDLAGAANAAAELARVAHGRPDAAAFEAVARYARERT